MRFSPLKNERHLEAVLTAIAILLGALHAWAGRHAMNPDGISYLDMGDAFLRGDLGMAINAYWSPLYALLIGIANYVIKPSLYGEFAVVHLVNFFIFVGALLGFRFFLHSVIAFLERYRNDDEKEGVTRLSLRALIAIGYSLFLVVSLNFITLANVSPDLLVAAFLFIIGGILLSLNGSHKNSSVRIFIILGGALGFGYLAKTFMFPFAFVILLVVALCPQKNFWRHAGRVAAACAVFFLLSAPWILAISRAKGKLTFGESGELTYAWHVNGVRLHTHWQGEEGVFGMPIHPSRIIYAQPPVYEFNGPVRGTYPPWYDPSYWYEGTQSPFNMSNQFSALRRNARLLYETLVTFQVWSVAIGFAIMTLLWHRALRLREVVRMGILFLPAAAGTGAYLFVLIQPRYIAAFCIFFFLGWASLIRLPRDDESKRVTYVITTVVMIALIFSLAISTGAKFARLRLDTHEHAQTAEELTRKGIRAGDPIAIIGWQFNGASAYWARLARLRIIAESVPFGGRDFWVMESAVKMEMLEAFRNAGAKAVVTEGGTPAYADLSGWEPLGAGGRYVFRLE